MQQDLKKHEINIESLMAEDKCDLSKEGSMFQEELSSRNFESQKSRHKPAI